MQKRYKTDYSNQVHQLTVSVSRHYYITSDGRFKSQQRPFEVRLDKPETFTKRHIVHYLIRDHFSGLFYAEITDVGNIFPVFDFLYRAWSRKENHPLYGVPDGMTVTKSVFALWPELTPFLEKITVRTIPVTSGFQGGIRDLRTLEEELRCYPYQSGHPPHYKEVFEYAPLACSRFNSFDVGRVASKKKVWQENLTETVYVPLSKEAFGAGNQADIP